MISRHFPVTSAVTKFNLALTRKTSITPNDCFLFSENTIFLHKIQPVLCTQSLQIREGITDLENKAPIFYEWPAHLSVTPAALIWTFFLSRHFIQICKWLTATQHLLYHSGPSKKNWNHTKFLSTRGEWKAKKTKSRVSTHLDIDIWRKQLPPSGPEKQKGRGSGRT